MRRFSATFLVLIYLTTFYKVAVPYVGFYANQDVIAFELCINQDKPELKCNGKCYLKQKLDELSKSQDQSNPLIPVKISSEDVSNIHLFSETVEMGTAGITTVQTHPENKVLPSSLVFGPIVPPPRG